MIVKLRIKKYFTAEGILETGELARKLVFIPAKMDSAPLSMSANVITVGLGWTVLSTADAIIIHFVKVGDVSSACITQLESIAKNVWTPLMEMPRCQLAANLVNAMVIAP